MGMGQMGRKCNEVGTDRERARRQEVTASEWRGSERIREDGERLIAGMGWMMQTGGVREKMDGKWMDWNGT